MTEDMYIDIMLYRTDEPGQREISLRIPMAPEVKQRLLLSQEKGLTLYENLAVSNLATALGTLNGMYGFPLRVREVEK